MPSWMGRMASTLYTVVKDFENRLRFREFIADKTRDFVATPCSFIVFVYIVSIRLGEIKCTVFDLSVEFGYCASLAVMG